MRSCTPDVGIPSVGQEEATYVDAQTNERRRGRTGIGAAGDVLELVQEVGRQIDASDLHEEVGGLRNATSGRRDFKYGTVHGEGAQHVDDQRGIAFEALARARLCGGHVARESHPIASGNRAIRQVQ